MHSACVAAAIFVVQACVCVCVDFGSEPVVFRCVQAVLVAMSLLGCAVRIPLMDAVQVKTRSPFVALFEFEHLS